MTLVYTLKLGLKACSTNVGMEKINSSIFKMFKVVMASFKVKNKLKKAQFF